VSPTRSHYSLEQGCLYGRVRLRVEHQRSFRARQFEGVPGSRPRMLTQALIAIKTARHAQGLVARHNLLHILTGRQRRRNGPTLGCNGVNARGVTR
jgi:hypothetical protein